MTRLVVVGTWHLLVRLVVVLDEVMGHNVMGVSVGRVGQVMVAASGAHHGRSHDLLLMILGRSVVVVMILVGQNQLLVMIVG